MHEVWTVPLLVCVLRRVYEYSESVAQEVQSLVSHSCEQKATVLIGSAEVSVGHHTLIEHVCARVILSEGVVRGW